MRKHVPLIAGAAATAVAVAALVATSLLYANSHGAEAIAHDASIQLRAQQALSAATVARSRISEVVIVDQAIRKGVADRSDLTAAIGRANDTLEETGVRVAGLEDQLREGSPITDASSEFVSSSQDLIDITLRGESDESVEAATEQVATSFEDLTAELVQERDSRERQMAAVRDNVGEVARAARVAVAFLVPALTVGAVLAVINRRHARGLEKAEQERREQLRVAKDEFLNTVAHELRTPLTAIVGAAELLRKPTETIASSTRAEMEDLLADQAIALADVVDDLLVFARGNIRALAVRDQVVDISKEVETIKETWKADSSTRLSISGRGHVMADSVRLRQVLRNLLSNAVRFGGDNIDVRIIPDGSVIRIEVVDDGPGIPSPLRERIFDPYEHGEATTKPASFGLGLAVARQLVERMSGSLDYESRPTESAFTLTLPAARSGMPHVSRASGRPSAHPKRPITEEQVRSVIESNTVDIEFQPIVDTDPSTPHMAGLEAIARFSAASASDWQAAAAAAGLVTDLEAVILRSAIQAFAAAPPTVLLFVDVTFQTLTSRHLAQALEGIPPSRVILQVPESSLITRYQQASDQIEKLRTMGYRLAVDDMGTAGTDLWHLVKLRPSFVKLHVSLLRDSHLDSEKRSVMTGVHWLAHTLSLKLIADGVERDTDVDLFRQEHISWAQGFRFGRPATLADLSFVSPQTGDPADDSPSPSPIHRDVVRPVGGPVVVPHGMSQTKSTK